MTSWRTDSIVAQLTQPIPTRPKPPPKPRASWAKLKPGTPLRYLDGSFYVVDKCDSEGCILAPASGWGVHQRLTDPDWQSAGWSRVRKLNAKRPKKPRSIAKT